MGKLSDELQELFELTLWSLWTELGVPGVERHHAGCAVDVEATIAHSPYLVADEARLIGLALDWVVAHHGLVSSARIRGLLRSRPDPERAAFDAFAARVNQDAPNALPRISEQRPSAARRSGKTIPLDLSRPSLSSLRYAAIFGVGIKASVLSELQIVEAGATTTELAQSLAYQRRPVALALEPLVSAGVVRELRGAGRVRYQIRNREALIAFADPAASRPIHWPTAFAVLADLRGLVTRHSDLGAADAVVAITKLSHAHRDSFMRLQAQPPRWTGKPGVDVDAFKQFALDFARTIAQPQPPPSPTTKRTGSRRHPKSARVHA